MRIELNGDEVSAILKKWFRSHQHPCPEKFKDDSLDFEVGGERLNAPRQELTVVYNTNTPD